MVLTALSLNPRAELKRLLKRAPITEDQRPHREQPRAILPQRRLNPSEIARLIERYQAGASVPVAVAEFGIHRTTVLRILERHGVPRRPETRKLTDEQVIEAADLYASGLSTVKVGAIFGVDAETIRKAFMRIGVQLRSRRGIKDPSDQ